MGPGFTIFTTALLVRLALVAIAVPAPSRGLLDDVLPRPHDAEGVARQLALGNAFARDTGTWIPHPTARVAPVAPWLARLGFRSFAQGSSGYRRLVLAQCLLGALVPLLLLGLTTALWGSGVGTLAAWIAALDPMLLLAAQRLSPDVVFGAALMTALAATAAWIKTPRRGRALGVGLLWGVAILCQPSITLLPLAVAAWAWVPLGLTIAPADRRVQILLLIGGILCLTVPWSVRSSIVARGPVIVATGSGTQLEAGNNAAVWWSTPGSRRPGGRTVPEWHVEQDARGEAYLDRAAAGRAWEFLSGRVAEWPLQAVHKVAFAWGRTPPVGADDESGRSVRPVDPRVAWALLLIPAAAWGVARLRSSPRRWFQLLPVLVVAYGVALAVIYSGPAGLRVALEPLAVAFAAVGIDDLRRRTRVRARGFRVIEGTGQPGT